MRIGSKCCGGTGEASGEVAPEDIAGHIEKHLRQTIGGQSGNVTEDDGEDYGGKQRLYDEPQWAKDGLLIARDEIAPYK